MAEQLIPWLNGRLDLRQAYTFDRNHITAMLQNIVLSPGVYGVPAQNVARLMSIHQDITRLRIEAPMLTHILHDNVVVNDDDIVMEDVTSTAG
ncbi:hypothetical protein APSETT444_006481 [Aspergillus pseudonomiae]